jgi:PrtD family type I secretion system ABC transporter
MTAPDKSTLKSTPLDRGLHACKVMFKFALVFGCIINLLMLATPIYSMQVLDRVISSGNRTTLVMLTLVVGGALLLLAIIQGARAFALVKMGEWFERNLSEVMFSNSIQAAASGKGGPGSQNLRDLQTIKSFLISPMLLTMLDTPWAIIFIIVLFIIHTYIGLLAVVGGLLLVTIGIISDRLTKPIQDKTNETYIHSMRQVDQASRNAEVVHVMGLLPNIIKNWQTINKVVQDNQSLASKREHAVGEFTKFIRMFLQISVTGLGAWLVLNQEITTGAIIASGALVGRALAPFEAAIRSWKTFLNCKKAYQRLQASLRSVPEKAESISLPAPEGNIAVEELYYSPPNHQMPMMNVKPIINNISFSLKAGEVMVMIGPSASGKTTLAKLIVGALKPNKGVVRLDNANLEDWRQEELGPYLGYLPQDVELFSGSIKDNIARMDKSAKSEDIIEAAKLAGVHDMILRLPKGYDTEIGVGGSVLSGGQRQRIGLARAFYGYPKLIVLDEPNASLDSVGELALNNSIMTAKSKGITTIVISHRTSILEMADKILAIRDGEVFAFGPKEEALQAMLVKADQFGNARDKSNK